MEKNTPCPISRTTKIERIKEAIMEADLDDFDVDFLYRYLCVDTHA